MLKLEPNQDCKCSSISFSKLSTLQPSAIKKASVKGQETKFNYDFGAKPQMYVSFS